MSVTYTTPLERFRRKVQIVSNGCWEWRGAKDGRGYGALKIDGRMVGAHRFAYEEFVGPLDAGFHVCHTCDNPACVHPGHLFQGTHNDNMADMVAKGRQARREGHGRAKLSEGEVWGIKQLLAQGRSCNATAKIFGVSSAAVWLIGQGRNWAGAK